MRKERYRYFPGGCLAHHITALSHSNEFQTNTCEIELAIVTAYRVQLSGI